MCVNRLLEKGAWIVLTCTQAELRWRMLRQQCLSAPADTVEQAATQLLGCRAAEGSTPYLSLFWRVRGFDPSLFDRAVHHDRSLVRVKGPRGTYYWVTLALAPLFLAAARNEPFLPFLDRWGMQEGEFHAVEEEVTLAISGQLLSLSELKKRIPMVLQRPLHRKGFPPSTGRGIYEDLRTCFGGGHRVVDRLDQTGGSRTSPFLDSGGRGDPS